MSTSLGSRTLSDHLLLQGIEGAPGVAHSARRTLGGRTVVQIGPTLSGGRLLQLQSDGHLKQADVDAIKAIEAAGQVVTLIHPRATLSVLVVAVELEPDQQLVNPSASGADPWYSGTITLQEV
jgi:hypothetical protein